MTDIFREVDEALQKEKLERIWRDYGSLIIGGILAIILGTALSTGWTSWQTHRNEQATTAIMAALEDKDPAAKLAALAAEGGGDRAVLAQLMQAGTFAEKGAADKAAPLFKQVYESGAPESLRDLSRIFYVRAQQQIKAPTAEEAKGLIDILSPVMNNAKSPWTWQARLETAVLTAGPMKNPAGALDVLSAFDKAEGVSPTVKDKATALKQVYAAQRATK